MATLCVDVAERWPLGTHSFVCLWAVTQPVPAPLNVKDTMASKSLSSHIFGIITKINFDLSPYGENKNPWVSDFIWLWFSQLRNGVGLDWFIFNGSTHHHVFLIMAKAFTECQ